MAVEALHLIEGSHWTPFLNPGPQPRSQRAVCGSAGRPARRGPENIKPFTAFGPPPVGVCTNMVETFSSSPQA
ncbi:hypothetical protein BV133_3444 [Blastochloris viridis]|uniref:Uncharacterized protein n=1 Tax=Blastochloris viridis TaxID=1079 RepID=A0A182D7C5_BLAVI|nr:hypothetical protein BV133_3444 [Blastochloris viridis]